MALIGNLISAYTGGLLKGGHSETNPDLGNFDYNPESDYGTSIPEAQTGNDSIVPPLAPLQNTAPLVEGGTPDNLSQAASGVSQQPANPYQPAKGKDWSHQDAGSAWAEGQSASQAPQFQANNWQQYLPNNLKGYASNLIGNYVQNLFTPASTNNGGGSLPSATQTITSGEDL